ncbi:MAG: type II toxin-antitoxin system HicA family toxin [Actinobacteria bacterium]|nr:type II toxin-antitoxin system HicA family toxin [Actinomycetota bacterium]
MAQYDKIISKILSGISDKNISFSGLCNVLKYLGFKERIKGNHHIFYKDGIREILNLQPKDSKAKQYQVKQIRNIILKYKIRGEQNV